MRARLNDYRLAFAERGRGGRFVRVAGEITGCFVYHLRAAHLHRVANYRILYRASLWPPERCRLHCTMFGHWQLDGDVVQGIRVGIT